MEDTKIRTKPFPPFVTFGEDEKKAVNEVLDSGLISGFIASAGPHFLGGPKVRYLEDLFRDYFGSRFACAVNSATAGLHAALGACGVGPGDEVIVPPYTMSATASAVLMQSAIPIFADIDPETFAISPQAIADAITERTKAIIVVHLFGHPVDFDAIAKVVEGKNIKIIEDCAQAPGALYHGRKVGTLGDAGVFSFNQHKTVTCGEGGVVITNDEDLALRVQLIRNHGEAVVRQMEIKDISNTLGWNYRMTELEAAVAGVQFKKLDQLTLHRQELANYLVEKLSHFEELVLPQPKPDCTHAYFLFPIRLTSDSLRRNRAALVQGLNNEGIPFGAGYVKPLYLEPMYQEQICFGKNGWPFTSAGPENRPSYREGLCPVAERMHESELIHHRLCYFPATIEDMQDIVEAFKKVLPLV